MNTLAPPQGNTIQTADIDNTLSNSGARPSPQQQPIANNTIDHNPPVPQQQVIPEEDDMNQGANSNYGNTT
jgi:hypothetical protein